MSACVCVWKPEVDARCLQLTDLVRLAGQRSLVNLLIFQDWDERHALQPEFYVGVGT